MGGEMKQRNISLIKLTISIIFIMLFVCALFYIGIYLGYDQGRRERWAFAYASCEDGCSLAITENMTVKQIFSNNNVKACWELCKVYTNDIIDYSQNMNKGKNDN